MTAFGGIGTTQEVDQALKALGMAGISATDAVRAFVQEFGRGEFVMDEWFPPNKLSST